ncbi:MAG: hypothetical protein O2798_10510 [Chloroflexi bacterium]|nr:hypothetical protein [Chloroflexota bacterium]MDA1241255.1 hypothetical protein [Chloroflexota bacterium]
MNVVLEVSIVVPSAIPFAVGIAIVGWGILSGLVAFTGGQSSGLHEEFKPGERDGRKPRRG